jgi:hypothetical protein
VPSVETFREGNYVEYRGIEGSLSFAKITAIKTNDNGTVHHFLLQHKDIDDEFEGYEMEDNSIGPIFLSPEILKKLKFQQEGDTVFFSFAQHTISFAGYTDDSNPENLVYVLPHMRIHKPFSDIYNAQRMPIPQYFKNNTLDITNVHMFQNYCTDNGFNIDFSVLEK